jgi:hypothetical protein
MPYGQVFIMRTGWMHLKVVMPPMGTAAVVADPLPASDHIVSVYVPQRDGFSCGIDA